jgi:hypothetical protein
VLAEKVTALMSQYAFLLHRQVLSVGWAKGKSADRAHPGSTHAQDCWFCLASPQVKAHMIISISEHCYVALARGGIVDFHVLIVPIDCVPNRLHLSTDSKKDLLAYEVALASMFERMPQQGQPGMPPPPPLPPLGAPNAPRIAPSYLCVRFERAIRTKGKDHMQNQLVPVPSKFLVLSGTAPALVGDGAPAKLEDSPAVTTFFKCIANYGLDFFELQNTLDAGKCFALLSPGDSPWFLSCRTYSVPCGLLYRFCACCRFLPASGGGRSCIAYGWRPVPGVLLHRAALLAAG